MGLEDYFKRIKTWKMCRHCRFKEGCTHTKDTIKECIFYKKRIFFYLAPSPGVGYYSYDETCRAIANREETIRTYSLANISFDLLDLGYEIYLSKNGKYVRITPSMTLSDGKEIRKEHNLLRIVKAGCFDEFFKE